MQKHRTSQKILSHANNVHPRKKIGPRKNIFDPSNPRKIMTHVAC